MEEWICQSVKQAFLQLVVKNPPQVKIWFIKKLFTFSWKTFRNALSDFAEAMPKEGKEDDEQNSVTKLVIQIFVVPKKWDIFVKLWSNTTKKLCCIVLLVSYTLTVKASKIPHSTYLSLFSSILFKIYNPAAKSV